MMLKYSVTIRKIYNETRQQWCLWQPWWKFIPPAPDWQLAANAGLDPFLINKVMQSTLEPCSLDMCVCPISSTSHDPREDQAVAGLPIDCVGTRHLGFQQLINQARVRVWAWRRACVRVGLSQSSQQEWKRQPHDNVTSSPFIPATQHFETKQQQQPGNLKKGAWFTGDMTSTTNTNPPLPTPSRSSAPALICIWYFSQ